MKKIGSFILSAILISILVTGCGKADDITKEVDKGSTENKSIEITAMCAGTESDSVVDDYQAIIDDFNANNEFGATVKMEFYENEQYKTKLTTLMASNAVPDIFFTWELAYLEPFVRGGLVADITSYLEHDTEWKNSFSEGTLELLAYDGKNYAVPTQKTLCGMFYNKQLFEDNNLEVPTTYEDFLNTCEILKSVDVTPIAMCGTDSWIPAQFVQQISNGIAGMDLYNGIRNGENQWNDVAHIEAAQELQKMVDAGYFQEGFIGMGPEESKGLFTSGEAAMYFMGVWEVGNISNSSVKDVAGIFALPAKNPEFNNISVGSVDTNFAISESCENKDVAIAFLKHWTSTENEEDLLYNEGRMPAGVVEIDESKLNPLFAEVLELSNQQVGLTPWWDRAFGAGEGVEFNNTCVAVSGGEDPQTVFDNLEQFAKDNADR